MYYENDQSQESDYLEGLDDDPDFVNIQREIDRYLENESINDKYDEEMEKLLNDHISVHEIKTYANGLYLSDIKFTFKSTADLDTVFTDMTNFLEFMESPYNCGCQIYSSSFTSNVDLFRVFSAGSGFTTDGDIMYNKADFYRGIGQLRKGLSRNISSNPHIDLKKILKLFLNFLILQLKHPGLNLI